MRPDQQWLASTVKNRQLRDEFFNAGVSLATDEYQLLYLWIRGARQTASQSLVDAGKALERFDLALRQYARTSTRLEGLACLLHRGLLARRFYPVHEKLSDSEARQAAPLIELKLGVIAALNDFAQAIHRVIDNEVDEALRKVRSNGTTPAPRLTVTFAEALEESGQELNLIGHALEACKKANGEVNRFLVGTRAWFDRPHKLVGPWEMLEEYFEFRDLEEEWDEIRTTTLENYRDSTYP